MTRTETQLETRNTDACETVADDKKYLSNRGYSATVWRVCPGCGRELPETMYALRTDGRGRREACKACAARERASGRRAAPAASWMASINPGAPHPGAGASWTDQDRALVGEYVGRPTSELAAALGRTAQAVRIYVNAHSCEYCTRGGVVARR